MCRWKVVLSVLCLIAVVGCQTTPIAPPQPAPLTTVTVSNELEIATPEPITAPAPIVPAVTPPSTVAITRPPWPTNWVNAWIPLESWRKYNNLEKLTVVPSNPHPIYQFWTSQGAVSVKIGTRVAWCNGWECWLGFAPQTIKGLPCVHWLDAQKVLQPLVNPLPSFPEERTIVLDPGHGGVDSGTISALNGRYEKEYTLDWALRLQRLLVTNGWKVILTRSVDKEVSLSERVALADAAKADLFLSLHFNSGLPNKELAGVETYCLTPTGMPSSLLRTSEDDVSQSYPNNTYDEENLQMAVRLHGAILRETNGADRGVRRARFMGVLRPQARPAVLIEGGYLSNLAEARKIAKPEYRQQLAEALAKALKAE